MAEIIHSSRRGFITGLVSLLAAPAVVRASSLMPVSGAKLIIPPDYAELARITREAFLPNVVTSPRRVFVSRETVDLYQGGPSLAFIWNRNG